jgi:L-lactate dehydrogenase complex protein LldG
MTLARDDILAAVRAARPPAVSLPDVRTVADAFARPAADETVARFVDAAHAASAVVMEIDRASVASAVQGLAPADALLSAIPDVPSSVAASLEPRALSTLGTYVCRAELGVGENGAVWIAPSGAAERAALFLALHVIVVIARSAIVADLHEAYARLNAGSVPFGVFVAGPSKTADIEQALVIGAHGPTRFTILLT